MNDILKFRVGIQGLENKIYREIEITDRRTLADLAYTILATFNSLAYHAYKIYYKKNQYYCSDSDIESPLYKDLINATKTKLKNLELKENDSMRMDYDFGSTTTFEITFLGKEKIKSYFDEKKYPRITKGEGYGMIEDVSDFSLQDIVEDIDKLGYSKHYFTFGYETDELYDYRKYDIEKDNNDLKGEILAIKNGYEVSGY